MCQEELRCRLDVLEEVLEKRREKKCLTEEYRAASATIKSFSSGSKSVSCGPKRPKSNILMLTGSWHIQHCSHDASSTGALLSSTPAGQ